MKFCKQHRESFRNSVEYTYRAAYNDAEKGEMKTEALKKKEIRRIGTVLLLTIQSGFVQGFGCNCQNDKFIDLQKRIDNLEMKL